MPRLAHFANDQKLQALSRGQTLRTADGVWFRHKNDFIFIGAIISKSTLFLVYQYRFDEQHRLSLARMINKIDFINNQWIAYGVAETSINQESTTSRKIPIMLWDVDIKPKIISVSANEPDEMTLHELRQLLRDRKLSHQSAINYQVAYWQRLMQPSDNRGDDGSCYSIHLWTFAFFDNGLQTVGWSGGGFWFSHCE